MRVTASTKRRRPQSVEATRPPVPRQPVVSPRRVTAVLFALMVGWALVSTGLGREAVLNPGGWPAVRDFLVAIAEPAHDSVFVQALLSGTLVTIAYAVLGSAMAVLIGLGGAFPLSQTRWRRGGGSTSGTWFAVRLAAACPRGLHESIWGLALINLLGLDPLVGILALGIPFGAITAKVFADLIDDAPQHAYAAILAAGGGRGRAFCYGLLPLVLPDFISYAFYRLECAMRSAVILGMLGAGGLGFQLALSFASLNYAEMWTAIGVLIALCAGTDALSIAVRRRLGPASATPPGLGIIIPRPGGEQAAGRRPGSSSLRSWWIALAVGMVAWSWSYLDVRVTEIWSPTTLSQLRMMIRETWPPRADPGTLLRLVHLSVETIQMSVVSMAVATAGGIAVAVVSARPPRRVGQPSGHPWTSPVRRAASVAARATLLVCRAVPPPVWALALLLVMVPGPLPGALALAVYNFGILGRLMAEVVENADPRPAAALEAGGASKLSSWSYGTWPQVAPRLLALGMYRWEVTIRETVIVGLVGAGGIGRLLKEQLAALEWSGVASTLVALIALTLLVDMISSRVREVIR